MPASDEDLRFQYDKLRTEILNNDTLAVQLLGVTVLLVTAAMGFGLHSATPQPFRTMVFLAAICMLFMSMLQTIERMRGTFLIASYMRTFLEQKTEHIKWETRLKKFRELSPGYGHKRFNTFLWIYVLIAVSNLFLIIIYTVIICNQPNKEFTHLPVIIFPITSQFIAIIILIISLVAIFLMVRTAIKLHTKYVEKNAETFDHIWEQVAGESTSPDPQSS